MFVKLQVREQGTNLYGDAGHWGIWRTLWYKLVNSETVVIPQNRWHSV